MPKFVQILINDGDLPEHVDIAPYGEDHRQIAEYLMAAFPVTETQIAEAVATEFRVPYVHVDSKQRLPDTILNWVRNTDAWQDGIIPLYVDSGKLTLLTAFPNCEIQSKFEFATNREVDFAVAENSVVNQLIAANYGVQPDDTLRGMTDTSLNFDEMDDSGG